MKRLFRFLAKRIHFGYLAVPIIAVKGSPALALCVLVVLMGVGLLSATFWRCSVEKERGMQR